MDRRLLFVLGLARSGTTVLTRLLNSHSEIALGMERYKMLVHHGAAAELGPALFEPARFFDFSDGLTNVTPATSPRWATYYQDLAEKYDAATYVGDKVTGVRIRRIVQQFPAARVVAIVRDPVEVAASWQRRADNPDDHGWRSTRGAPQAAVEWNRGVRRLLRASAQAAGRVRIVEHHGFFGDPDGSSLDGVLDWLQLPRTAAVDTAFARAHVQFVSRVREQPVALTPGDRKAVESTADGDAWRAVQRLVEQQA